MTTQWTFRKLIAWMLVSALFLTQILPAQAAALADSSLPEESAEVPASQVTEIPVSTALPPETQEPAPAPETEAPSTEPETTAALPEATEPPPSETVPETTVPETTQETRAPETQAPATEPTELTHPPETILPEPETSTQWETEPSLPVPEIPKPVQVMTIAQAQAMLPGTEGITVQGTVVYADGIQAVLQDDTGGIRLSFSQDPGTVPGEQLLVTGTRSGGLAVEDFEVLGTGELPAQDSTLLDAPEELRVKITGARLEADQLSQNGFSLTLAGALPADALSAERLDVWGVILDGCFYADAATASTQATADAQAQEETVNWNIFFGQLHGHTKGENWITSSADAFQEANGPNGNMDFYAITDDFTELDSSAWSDSKQAEADASETNFVPILGYEMRWPYLQGIGHISTFNTLSWESWKQYTLESYYAQLGNMSQAISQFNHPWELYGNFNFFSQYDPAYDRVMHLLELNPADTDPTYYYDIALEAGWHLAPTLNGNHNPTAFESVRTAILAKDLNRESVFDALRNMRVYATTDPDLRILYELNGQIMGGTIHASGDLSAYISIADFTDNTGCTVEIISAGGAITLDPERNPTVNLTSENKAVEVPAGTCSFTLTIPGGMPYYYLKIIQEDDIQGNDFAVTAPVWVDTYDDIGVQGFATSEPKPLEGQEITLSLELYNKEQVPFVLEAMEFYAGETLVHQIASPGVVQPMNTLPYSFPVTWMEPGGVIFRAVVTGTVAGEQRQFETSLTLTYQAKKAEPSSAEDVHLGVPGTVYRIQGYVTAGNHNPYNTFRSTVYVQDDTGGIAVEGYWVDTLQVGQPVEVTGILERRNGNRVLRLTGYELLNITYYRYAPETSPNKMVMDYALSGGQLMQVEGEVVSLQKTADGKGISRVTLKDIRGDLATVVIDSNIYSGTYGTNTLAAQIKKGRTVRAIGLVHRDEYGATVLRVRNCDEVVYVPATLDPSNPKTRDPFWFLPWP